MANRASSPFHLGPQTAKSLLGPVEARLLELEARLTQYVERIPMSDADREVISRARQSVAQDRSRIVELRTKTER